ncbi:MAG: hypothetical protein LC795_19510 [Acidobacteria bacterium]|nr:hypothetical protein [Acidobacteriota bacterium]
MLSASAVAGAQTRRRADPAAPEFGPNVTAYLGYLRNEQEVVDDRASRREIDRRYYLHNSNRINALRQMAMRIARASGNDYLPELEAISEGEFEQYFEEPLPRASELQQGLVLQFKLRFLGAVLSRGEKFYLFARLDPYEQAELRKQGEVKSGTNGHASSSPPAGPDSNVRPRRVSAP